MLSLLGYDAAQGKVPDEVDHIVEERGYANGALAVFLRMEGVDSTTFSSTEFFRCLVMNIKYLMPITRRVNHSWSLGVRTVVYSDVE